MFEKLSRQKAYIALSHVLSFSHESRPSMLEALFSFVHRCTGRSTGKNSRNCACNDLVQEPDLCNIVPAKRGLKQFKWNGDLDSTSAKVVDLSSGQV